MNDCRSVREDLLELSDGTLGPDRLREIEAHLALCAACRAYAGDLERLEGAFTDLAAAEERAVALPAAARPGRGRWISLAASLLFLVAGFFSGRATAPVLVRTEVVTRTETEVRVAEVERPAPGALASVQAARAALALGDAGRAGGALEGLLADLSGEGRLASVLLAAAREESSGRLDAAARLVEEAVALCPGDAAIGPTLVWLGAREAAAGRTLSAAARLEAALAAGVAPLPDLSIRLELARLHEAAGRGEAARAAYARVASQTSGGGESRAAEIALARLEISERGDLRAAEDAYRRLAARGEPLPREAEDLLALLEVPEEREAIEAYLLARRGGEREVFLEILVRDHPSSEATLRLFREVHGLSGAQEPARDVRALEALAGEASSETSAYCLLLAGDVLAVRLRDLAAARRAYGRAAERSSGRLRETALELATGAQAPGLLIGPRPVSLAALH